MTRLEAILAAVALVVRPRKRKRGTRRRTRTAPVNATSYPKGDPQ